MGLEASVTAWMNQERTKQNVYMRRKNSGLSSAEDLKKAKQHYRWLRKPRYDLGAALAAKNNETVYFYDKIANSDLVVILIPVFLVLVLLLNLIA